MKMPRLVVLLALVWMVVGGVPLEARAASLPDDPTEEGVEASTVPPLTAAEAALLAQFAEPDLTHDQEAQVLAKYRYVDPGHVVPKGLRERALVYFDANQDHIANKKYLTVVDFSQRSKLVRLFIMDMTSGTVLPLHVAHGSGSDPDNDGTATLFSNSMNSHMSSVGFYKTAETYTGKHGLSLRMDGLSDTNSNVRVRAVVVHGADYVEDTDVKPGRSWGCLAVSAENCVRVVNALKGGSVILADRSASSPANP